MTKQQFKVVKEAQGFCVVLNDIIESVHFATRAQAAELANAWNVANRWTDDDYYARAEAAKLGVI